MYLQHTKNPAEPHSWFAWHPVRVLKRGPAGPQFYVAWLSTVTRRMVVIQGSVQWVYDLIDKPVKQAPPPAVTPPPAPQQSVNFDLVAKGFQNFIEHMSEEGWDIQELTLDELINIPPGAGVLYIDRVALRFLRAGQNEGMLFDTVQASGDMGTYKSCQVYSDVDQDLSDGNNCILLFTK